MAKRIIGALFIIIVFSVIVALFTSFGMAQNNTNGAPAVELQLNLGWCSDVGPDPPGFDEEEDFASCSGKVLNTNPDEDQYTDRFEFTIHNGYPGYECTLNLTVHNAGTVTLWINHIEVYSTAPPTEISVSDFIVIPSPIDGSVALAPNGLPGDSAVVIFTVSVLEGAKQGQGTTDDYENVISGSIKVDDQKL